MRNNGKNLCTTLLKHVKDTLNCQESVGVLFLTDTLKEDRKVVVVVELLNLDFPVNLELRTVLNGDGKISSIVEATEFRGRHGSHVKGTGNWPLRSGLFLGLVKADDLSTKTLTLLESG